MSHPRHPGRHDVAGVAAEPLHGRAVGRRVGRLHQRAHRALQSERRVTVVAMQIVSSVGVWGYLHVGGGAVPRHVERQRVVAWRGAALRRLAEAGAAVGEPDLARHVW